MEQLRKNMILKMKVTTFETLDSQKKPRLAVPTPPMDEEVTTIASALTQVMEPIAQPSVDLVQEVGLRQPP